MGFPPPDGGQTMNSTFGVTVTEYPYRAVVAVSGELDLDSCPYVTEATDALPLRGQTLVIDLSAVTFMDSMGLSMLLRLRRRAENESGTLELCGIGEQVARVLELAEARPLFTCVPCP
ncbi:STAS domain-containing protein [Streptomyces sp. NPDC056670]|uniref:STAS domain-containing protein n=1 Tax=Streptomyces sp. NPDC056670 TaxID=3345904 RepID=UPI0036A200D9